MQAQALVNMHTLDGMDISAGTLAQRHELGRSASLATITRVNIEFYGHIDKILRQTI